jgi:hypothetical protein
MISKPAAQRKHKKQQPELKSSGWAVRSGWKVV